MAIIETRYYRSKLMYCKNCGNKLNEDSRFCRNCGQPVDTDKTESNSTPKQGHTQNTNKPFSFKNIPMVWKVVGGIASFIILTLAVVLVMNIANQADSYLYETYNNNAKNNYGGNNNNNNDDAKFAWVVEPGMTVKYSNYANRQCIEGTIKNITDKTYYVIITFILYDSLGNQIGTATDSMSNFKGGNTWEFSAENWGDKAANWEFSDITYY